MRIHALLWVVAVCGCSAPRSVERAPLCPPLSIDVPAADLTREGAGRAAADVSPPVPAVASSPTRETPPTYRTVVHVVEVPVLAEPSPAEEPRPFAYDPAYAGYVDDVRYRESPRRWREPFFPVNTALGAGVGAILGHQSRHRGRGALIGGSLGLLLDLDRWFR